MATISLLFGSNDLKLQFTNQEHKIFSQQWKKVHNTINSDRIDSLDKFDFDKN